MKVLAIAAMLFVAANSTFAAQAQTTPAKGNAEVPWWTRGVKLENKSTEGVWTVQYSDDLVVLGKQKNYSSDIVNVPSVSIYAISSTDNTIFSRGITVTCLGRFQERITVAATVIDPRDINRHWAQQFKCGDSQWRVGVVDAKKLLRVVK